MAPHKKIPAPVPEPVYRWPAGFDKGDESHDEYFVDYQIS